MIEESTFEEDMSRSCLVLASHMENCFTETYGRLGTRIVRPLDPEKFDNASSKVQEIAIRTILTLAIALSAAFAGVYIGLSIAILTLGSRIFKAVGFYLQKNDFVHIKGKAKEINLSAAPFEVMIWDAGTKKSDPQGLLPWQNRKEGFVQAIKEKNPAVLVLQGVADPIHTEEMIKELESHYAHFFIHIGAKAAGNLSGYLIATKAAVHNFAYTNFSSSEKDAPNGFATFELKTHRGDKIPSIRMIAARLDEEMDLQERELVKTLAKQKRPLSTLFVGATQKDLSHLLHYTFEGDTHSDELAKQYNPLAKAAGSTKNLIALFRYRSDTQLPVQENKIDCKKSEPVRGFDESYNTRTAIADNHAVIASLQFKH